MEKKAQYCLTHPDKRRLIFVGDLVDRGPRSPEVLRLVIDSVARGVAFCVNGNHDDKLRRKLMGRAVQMTHGLQETMDQLSTESDDFKQKIRAFLANLPSHYLLDAGRLAVAHAGVKAAYLGHASRRIDAFCMYGKVGKKQDQWGRPVREPWAHAYHGKALIVYGHTPVVQPAWINNTVNIDTGCVFGGKLTALRYPEQKIVSIKAAKMYYPPMKPLEGG